MADFTRDDEFRLFALRAATEDKFRFDKGTAEENRDRVMADARAYHAFLTEGSTTKESSDA